MNRIGELVIFVTMSPAMLHTFADLSTPAPQTASRTIKSLPGYWPSRAPRPAHHPATRSAAALTQSTTFGNSTLSLWTGSPANAGTRSSTGTHVVAR